MTAEDLVGLGIVDEVVPEPFGGAHNEPDAVFAAIGERITAALDELAGQDADVLVQKRYDKLRAIGVYN